MIENIYNLGDDAFSNLFQVVITEDEEKKFEYRTQNFTIPSSGHETYPIDFMQFTIEKPKPKVILTKEFTIPFRVDANWEIYNWLRDKKNAAIHIRDGVMSTLPDIEFGVSVNPLDASGEPIADAPTWNFYHVWVKSLPDISFDYTNSDPITIEPTFGFVTMTDDE